MNALETLKALNAGKKVAHKTWTDKLFICFKNNQFQSNNDYPGGYPMLNLLLGDTQYNRDWEEYNEKPVFDNLKIGERFKWTPNGAIMQKVYIPGGGIGYMNTQEYWVAEIDLPKVKTVIRVQ